ncbi:hypothetical protein E4634_14235 [Mangrovimicrobium sediminis]|uniref:Beta-ketoacyl synthase-like N-terminal domain-containing protein n=1 Tax=Mangrovimicrobium sediminis TaxID=2562682 RepID=A0A4Z0LZR1_9GAMM|nr:beta-ketoacyl synthase chain length factor [Haliea sp. SAOS-164]TGD72676.1 hypothetical protein E4634_14235 [Haliea sp. SAOS-164]
MQVAIRGIGALGEGFSDWDGLRRVLAGGESDAEQVAPRPQLIPANERRRAPLAVRLAVEACSQAVAASGLDAADLACVFTSGLGDTDLTDYMCRELAGERKQLSPTKFHNSVHNAAAGYWTIATDCRQPANSVAGLEQSVPVALLEGVTQCLVENRPVIIAFYDIPTRSALAELFANREAFAAALVITPEDDPAALARLACEVEADPAPQWPQPDLPPALSHSYQYNPAARVLPLLVASTGSLNAEFSLPLSGGTRLQCRVSPTGATPNNPAQEVNP